MPEIQLKVAVWTNDKPHNYNLLHKDLNLEARVAALQQALLQARTWLDAPSDRSGCQTLRIFIAPENILVDAKPLEQSQEKASAVSFEDFKVFCQQDKLEDVCTGILPALSQGLLFIPGTVLLKKPLKSKESLKLGEHEARMRSSYRAEYPNAPKSFEQSFVDVEMKKLEKKLEHIDRRTVGEKKNPAKDPDDVQIARNVALVFFDGGLLSKYKKRSEHKPTKRTGELTSGDKEAHTAIKFFPGYKDGVFSLRLGDASLSCGIEVCADHAGGQLRYSQSAQHLHLQFIVSDHVSNLERSIAVKKGGFIIHASTDKDVSGLFDHEFKRTGSGAPAPVKLTHGMLTYHEQLLRLPLS